jgi:hypothetical protein
MKIIMPKENANIFVNSIGTHAVNTGAGEYCYYDDYTSRGNYSWIDYPTETLYKYMTEEFITAYIQSKFPELNIQKIDEDTIFAFNRMLEIEQGESQYASAETTIEQEIEWRKNVVDVVSELEAVTPFSLEFNPREYNFNRSVPTVILEPHSMWYNQGKPAVGAELKLVAINRAANILYMPTSFNGMYMYPVCDNPEDYIGLPFALVYKNKKGFGNTVIITANKYSAKRDASAKSIFDALAEPFVWKKIISYLLWTPLEQLKKDQNNIQVPLGLQAKLLLIRSQNSIKDEILSLETRKLEARNSIESYIKDITTLKVRVSEYDSQIAQKQNDLRNKSILKAFEREIKSLKSLPYMERFEFIGDGITFYTHPIQVDDGPFLGGYEIHWSVTNKTLNFKNLVNPARDGELAHPHIYQGGDACLGNYSDIYFRFESGEYYVGMELVHEFLSTYNPDDEWGRRLIYFDPEWTFEDMDRRGILRLVEDDYEDIYFEVYGHYLRREVCDECGMTRDDCTCDRCHFCGAYSEDCECWICYDCGELVEDGCTCDRCDHCQELIRDCDCERCENCGELVDSNYSPHCECERCPEDDSLLDEDDERCTECEEFDCEYNVNEGHATTQDETLFEEEAV